jgi:hypothetical protein
MGHSNQSAGEETEHWLNFGVHAVELFSKFFHCGIFADNFAVLSTVQSYLGDD